ncbi:MAG: protein kinase [Pseudomonadota bacterium]
MSVDWRLVTREIQTLERLDGDAFGNRLSGLDPTKSETDDFLRRYFKNWRPHESFLRTCSVGENQPNVFTSGDRVGVWRIEKLIGAGGMGEVYEASRADGHFEQRVALKIMRPGAPSRRERFELERRRLARMDHPGVSRIIDGGLDADGRPFMAMEYVDGRPIDHFAAERSAGRLELLSIVIDLCAAVAHAHANLVLHGDIKPSNILVDRDGSVRLIDFGVSSLIEDDDETFGLFTIVYAAPEQLKNEPLSVATDIFALGMVLHQLLTGEPPARLENGGVVASQSTAIDADLRAIIQKATAERPEDRYRSVDALAEDLRAVRDGRTVAARNGGRLYTFEKLLTRFPVASALAAGVIASLTGGLAISLFMARQTQNELTRAEYFLTQAERSAAIEANYAGIIDQVFRTPEDSERIRQIMLQRARDAYAASADAPDVAAETILVAGRHFLFGGDFATTVDVLAPWAEQEFGDPNLVRGGKLLLAIAYVRKGDGENALPLIEAIEAAFDNPFERYSVERMQLLTEYALLTGDEQRIRETRDVVGKALDRTDVPEEKLTYLHFLQLFARSLGELQTGYASAQAAVQLFDEHPMMEVHGWGAVHTHLIRYQIFYRNDLDAASALVDRVLARGEDFVGPDAMSVALRLSAQIAMARGEFQVAEGAIIRARPYDMKSRGHDRDGRILLAELRAMQNSIPAAERELQKLSELDGEAREDGSLPPRVALAAAYVAARRDGPAAGSEMLARTGVTKAMVESELTWRRAGRRLTEMGVVWPDDPA